MFGGGPASKQRPNTQELLADAWPGALPLPAAPSYSLGRPLGHFIFSLIGFQRIIGIFFRGV